MSTTDQSPIKRRRVHFKLEPDEDGYPPFGAETLWTVEVGSSRYKVDNVPFFVRDVSPDDIIEALLDAEGILTYTRVIEPSSHTVLRVNFFQRDEKEPFTKTVQKLGCSTEDGISEGLLAIDVPPEVSLDKILDMLKEGESKGTLDYEEASLRHSY